MFAKFSALALLTPFVAALQLSIPEKPVSAGTVTINWTKVPSDDVFSLYLFNQIFHNSFAIANNVNPADETITLTLPVLPDGDGYTLAATNVGNVNEIYTQTSSFYIGPNPATTGSTSSTSAASSGSASGTLTVSNSVSSSGSGSASSTAPASSSSGFGVTVSRSSTSSGASSPASSSSASASASAAGNNNGAASFGVSKVAGVALAIVAGAMVAF